MGIYSRDYIREDRPGFLRADGSVIPWLIGVNVVVFLLNQASQQEVNRWLALDLDRLWPRPELWRLVTYGFCHGSTGHIFYNMISLWVFGRFIEPIYGPREFLGFYLAGILAAGLAFLGLDGAVGVAQGTIGASGGTMAVTILAAMHFPTARILMFFIIPIELRYLAILTVALDVLGFLGGSMGVANSAHLGGAAFGFLYYKCGWRVLNWLPGFRFRWPRRKAAVRIFQPEDEGSPIVSEETVDAILRKITAQGEASLTDEERSQLIAASRQKKARRGLKA